jgi:NADH dehydrogenase
VAVLVFGTAMQLQDMPPSVSFFYLALLVFMGAVFGLVFRYQPGAYAGTLSSGLLFGLLLWLIGPLTLVSAMMGHGPTWSVGEVSAAFPSLIGHLLYGGLTSFLFYVGATVVRFLLPEPAITPGVREPVRHVVILGGGFAGISAAQQLEKLCARDSSLEITLVSSSNYLLFTPMLAEVASSGLEAQHISTPARAALFFTRFHRAEVEMVDSEAQLVRIRTGGSSPAVALTYDHLVLALGSVPHFHDLPGVAENSFALKTLQDATVLRNHVITMLERADSEPDEAERRRLLTFVVAGAGFAGTEMIAELFDLAHSVLRYYPHVSAGDLRFVLIHSRERILPEISADLADFALRKLQARGIEFLLNRRVASATYQSVQLNDGTDLPTYTLVWTAGNRPNPALATISCEKNQAGAVVVDATLQVKGFTNMWAVGDCAQIPDVHNQGQFHPPTAQHALRQGWIAAENVFAALQGKPPKVFRFHTLGTLVALGHRTGVAEIRGWKFSGFLAWLMWRTIYLSKLPGLEKKVRVAFDWALDLFFPRDIVLTMNQPTPTVSQITGHRAGHGPGRSRSAQDATEEHEL